jgi:type II restriction enzyme
MKLTAHELYNKLVNEYIVVGEQGVINFTLKDMTISIETKDTAGSLLQVWLNVWFSKMKIDFEENVNTKKFPDFYLNKDDKKKDYWKLSN